MMQPPLNASLNPKSLEMSYPNTIVSVVAVGYVGEMDVQWWDLSAALSLKRGFPKSLCIGHPFNQRIADGMLPCGTFEVHTELLILTILRLHRPNLLPPRRLRC